MAAISPPVKFVGEPNPFLSCPMCKNILTDPAINVRCGHSFCRRCLEGSPGHYGDIKCPVDGAICDSDSVVVNRALAGQVDDLEIFCCYGLTWSDETANYQVNPDGCTEIVKLGVRREHEDQCVFGFVPCPYNAEKCGRIQRRDLDTHENICCHLPCPHRNKGCDFLGKQADMKEHQLVCGYRGFRSEGAVAIPDHPEVKSLKENNHKLEMMVKTLIGRVEVLEKSKEGLSSQLDICLENLQTMHKKYDELQEKVEKFVRLRRSPSSFSSTSRANSGAVVPRSPSLSSLLHSPKVESWKMPFHFKCIGTLRGHDGPVTCLQTWGHLLFSSSGDMVIKVWDLDALSKGCVKTMKGHSDMNVPPVTSPCPTGLSGNKDNQVYCMVTGDVYLYSSGSDRTIRAWRLEDGAEENVVQDAHDDVVVAMVCSEDFLFTSSKCNIKVWELASLKLKHTISGLHHWVRALAVNYGRDKLYSGSHNTIEIWDALGKFNLRGKIDHKFGSIHSLCVTSQYIIAGTYNRNIQVYDVQTQKHVDTKLSGHIGAVNDLVVSPSGRYLFSGSADSTIQVWNLENMLPIQSLNRHEQEINTLALHGDLLLSGSDDMEIKVFKYFNLM